VARRRPLLRPFLCLTAGAVGCIPVAHEERPTRDSRRSFSDAELAFVRPAATTREEVLLRLGDPDFAWDDGRVLCYAWRTSTFEMATLGTNTLESAVPHYLLVEFDDAARVRRFEVKADAAEWWRRRYSPGQLRREW
jgi:hypothetical protein